MRKTISLILCVAMLMSSLSFCFPALAIEFDFGVESAGEYVTTDTASEDAIATLTEDGQYTVTFVGDVNYLPTVKTDGGTLQLTNYYTYVADGETEATNIASTVSGKRFNGWTDVEGSNVPKDTIEVTGDTTVYAIVNYDINFAIPENQQAKYASATQKCTVSFADNSVKVAHIAKNNPDQRVLFGNLGVPAAYIGKIEIYIDKDYNYVELALDRNATGNDTNNSIVNSTPMVAKAGTPLLETTYYSLGSQGLVANNSAAPSATVMSADGEYAVVTYNPSSPAHTGEDATWDMYSNLNRLYVDTYEYQLNVGEDGTETTTENNSARKFARDISVRYVHFAEPENKVETVEATGLVAPEFAAEAVTAVTTSSGTTASAVTWTPALVNGMFDANTAYTATFTVAPTTGNMLTADTAVTGIDGAEVTKTFANGIITVSAAFPATKDGSIECNFNVTTEDTSVNMEEGTIAATGNDITFNVELVGSEEVVEAGATVEVTGKAHLVSYEDGVLVVMPEAGGEFTIKVTSLLNPDAVYEKTFTVDLAEGYKIVTVNFEGAVKQLPEKITAIVDANGLEVNLKDYLDVTPVDTTKRFNGWTATGEFKDLQTGVITVTEDTTLTAAISYDFNFAVPSNAAGWAGNSGIRFYDEANDVYTVTNDGKKFEFAKGGLKIPGAFVKDVVIYTDVDKTKGGVAAKTANGESLFYNMYFEFDGLGSWQDWYVTDTNADVTVVEEGAEYARTTLATGTAMVDCNGGPGNAEYPFIGEQNTSDITYIRIDHANTTGGDNLSFRYIHFEGYEDLDLEDVNLTVAAPTTGYVAGAVTADAADAKVAVEWSPALNEVNAFAGDTEYTATFTITPAKPYENSFAEDTKVLLNGEELAVTYENYGKKLVATKKFAKTAPYKDFELTINGPDKAGFTEYYTAEFSTNLPNELIVWSVDDEETATISYDGVLTAKKNGKVVITATPVYNAAKSVSKEVTIDAKTVTVKFAHDVDGQQLNSLPAEVTLEAGSYLYLGNYLSIEPKTSYLRFQGWTATGKEADLKTDKIKVVDQGNGEMTITAVINADYNFAIPSHSTGFFGNQGTLTKVGNTLQIVGTGNDESIRTGNLAHSPNKRFPVGGYKGVVWYYEDDVVINGTAAKISTTSTGMDNHFHSFAIGSTAYGPAPGVTPKKADLHMVTGSDGVVYAGVGVNWTNEAFSNGKWSDSMVMLAHRHDLFNTKYNAKLRYIRYIPFDKYEADLEYTVTDAAAALTDTNGIATSTVVYTDAEGATVTAFESGKTYTATITATVADLANYRFRADVAATVNGIPATVKLDTYKKTATVTATFTIYTDVITSATGKFEMHGMDGTKPEYVQLAEQHKNDAGHAAIKTTYPAHITTAGTLDLTMKAPAEGETLTVTVSDESLVSLALVEGTTYRLTAKGYLGEVDVTATYTKDGKVTATATETVKLISGNYYKPGLNIWTGTEEPFTFDDLTAADVSSTANTRVWANAAFTTEGTNNFMKFTGGAYKHFALGTGYPTIEAERPFAFNFKYKADAALHFLLIRNRDNQTDGNLRLISKNPLAAATEWTAYSQTDVKIESSKFAVSTAGNNGRTFNDEQYSNKNVYRMFFMNANNVNFYVDDIYAIPYYKITYHFADAEKEDEVLYVLPEHGVYVVDTTKGNFALTEGGEAVVTVELANADIDLYEVETEAENAVVTLVAGDKTVMVTTDGVIKNPAAYGLDYANFVCWYDATNNHYYEGDEVDLTAINGKTLTAYYQTVNAPAVVSIVEGNDKNVFSNPGFTIENVVDDGRTAVRISYDSATGKKHDALRASVNKSITYDPVQYSLLQLNIKHKDLWVGQTASATATPVNGNDNGYSALIRIFSYDRAGSIENPDNCYQPRAAADEVNMTGVIPIDDNYHIREIDLTTGANWKDRGAGFAWDFSYPAKTADGSGNNFIFKTDAYLDYMRVYRTGIFTVTYDTNAPAGATVVANVAADVNRGVGTGYLFKGTRPEVEGYIFMGWALSKSAADAGKTVESIDLVGDATVYASWKKAEAKVTAKTDKSLVDITNTKDESIHKRGFRTKATISEDFKNGIEEYGFIAAVSSLISKQYTSGLTFNSRIDGTTTIPYVSVAAYKKGDAKDVTKLLDDGSVQASAVIDYRNVDVKFYGTEVTVRSYAKFKMANGNEVVVYGTETKTSLYDEAKALLTTGSAAEKLYASEIIEAYEAYLATQQA